MVKLHRKRPCGIPETKHVGKARGMWKEDAERFVTPGEVVLHDMMQSL